MNSVQSTDNNVKKVKSYLAHHDVLPHLEVLGGADTKVDKINTVKQRDSSCSYVYIGDSPGDIIESKEAYVPCVAVTWGHFAKEDLVKHDPEFIADTVDELREILLEKV